MLKLEAQLDGGKTATVSTGEGGAEGGGFEMGEGDVLMLDLLEENLKRKGLGYEASAMRRLRETLSQELVSEEECEAALQEGAKRLSCSPCFEDTRS